MKKKAKKKAKDCGIRVYGNQHGSWIQVTDEKLAGQIELCAKLEGITPEQWMHEALEWYLDKLWDGIIATDFLEREHQQRMEGKQRASSSMD